ncbi:MAG: HicB family protein [Candidatus Magasanikbacteria bacterium CG_4_9_14_0_2_um_filter_42_11]|uniref:HicB family protein n=1 Tax=Candidatus Magasanikbacteria bacterium CG_4_9_14_0_2_um_filter_42_11 TaxID=1974643 RepID=A0A2M8F9C9_9BACT|nr:MAG: HicB family protein [Candidatus Magasanikbacteria bacterium CG10_big_fil_rev_8_21_14_0_10_43_9]PIY93017.1 MAG: HicB family protein [Candidatus Magasanikbacteria bacterium CG_4_10_14_0_8_um_filter_42_12]PJC52345.1 MAG: HicB family protein [Candidatus Magasanikbacteria bacterium CG_4_9_14_0_2_um_filter_42_11]
MRKIDLQSVVWKEGDSYISQCLDVDVSSFGKTKKEALAMLEDALSLYFQDMPLPKSKERVKNPRIASVTLRHA